MGGGFAITSGLMADVFLLLSHSPGGAIVELETHVVGGTREFAYISIQSVMCTCCV